MAAVIAAGCGQPVTGPGPTTTDAAPPSATTAAPLTTEQPDDPGTDDSRSVGARPAPDWLGTRVLTTTPSGLAEPQPTPDELRDRQLITSDTLTPPADGGFVASIEPLAGEPLERSTLTEGCPVPAADLRYLQVSFWGFDDRPHRGELIVSARVADDVVAVFEQLFEARFPIEEMRIVTPADLDAPPTGDGNNTSSFACRPVTGGGRFSEHAYGLAIDINPFHNPYVRGDVVLPELATAYLDRDLGWAGMITEGDIVVSAFDAIGWGWGGRWNSLKDYQHFALNDR